MDTTVKPKVRVDYIPAEHYISREIVQLEKRLLWPRVWQLACRLEEIPYPGDYVTYDINDESIIVMRETPERIRAYYNVCPHRGRRLVEGCGTAARLQCRFHGWQWGLDGKVIRILDREDWAGCPDMSDQDFQLAEIKLDTWAGFVFVNFDPHCEPLSSYLAPVPEFTDCFEFEKMRYRWYKSVRLPCNWKVALEAFSEGYHVFGTHPQLLDSQGDDVTRSFTYRQARHVRLPRAGTPAGRTVAAHRAADSRRRAPGHRQVLPGPGRPAEGDHHRARQPGRQAHPRRVPARHASRRAADEGGRVPARSRAGRGGGVARDHARAALQGGHRLARVPEHDLPDVARRDAVLPGAAGRRQPRFLLLRHLLHRPLCAAAASRR